MFRSTSILALLAAMSFPAQGADYGGDWGGDGGDVDFRSGYPTEPGDWAGLGDDDDPITIEAGVRYWYAIGRQSFSTLSGDFTSGDTSQIGELHLRIDDHSTKTFAKGIAGYSAVIRGDYDDPTATGTINDLAAGATVTCTFINSGIGTTRTQGFWSTHLSLVQAVWNPNPATVGGIATNGMTLAERSLCGQELSVAEVMGGFWSSVSKTEKSSAGKKFEGSTIRP